ncbi:MAG: 3-hydroxyacyl-CoA dehydrogenase NAD-binding domain-containing protein [Pseudomonadota bacterium]|nr:3-hydroxyacyl-CoA dehydrogenase NAD-binding domain-containing protein [Pseudomonadota bacterium]
MTDHVKYERDGDIAVITIDNGAVNALSHAVRQGLGVAVDRFAKDADAKALVITGAGRLFIGGADISEFGKPPREPFLPAVLNRIEAQEKPVVAAIHGVALGGGFEVALAAHYRIAAKDAVVGLPEVSLGVIPGAGGTQRVPRLAGVATALEMIPAAGRWPAGKALEHGLVDALSDTNDMRAEGVAYAKALLADGKCARPTAAMPRPEFDAEAFKAARDLWAKKAKGQVAQLTAIDAIEVATQTDLADGLKTERDLFMKMIDTPQRAGLIHAFFSERKVTQLPELKGVEPRDLGKIGVVGGGLMGSGIATAALLSHLPVVVVEQNQEAADKARATITKNLNSAVKRGKMTEGQRDQLLEHGLTCAVGYDALSDVDLAIEAVFEDIGVKKSVFAELDRVMKPGAVMATNTSYLDINEIAASTSRPFDVIGLHFFSPAHIMKLLEIVVADQTAADVTATGFALAKLLRKTPVRAGVCDGFIGNRILSTFRAAADRMVLAGASPYQVDAAIRDFGFAMGPYQVADLAGLDIGYMTRQRKAAEGKADSVQPTWADELYHMGRIGQKSGRGYYIYDDARKGTPDPEVDELIAAEREKAGVVPCSFTDDEIQRRYMCAMVNEGAKVLGDGIAARPLDIDVTLVAGYGFPRFRGGPMKWADLTGLPTVLADLERFAESDPAFWAPAPLLRQLVSEGRDFDSLNTGEGA